MSPITFNLDTAKTETQSICSICRELIAEGHNPDTLIEFIRDTTPVFKATPIGWWAARRVRESDDKGPMRLELIQ